MVISSVGTVPLLSIIFMKIYPYKLCKLYVGPLWVQVTVVPSSTPSSLLQREPPP